MMCLRECGHIIGNHTYNHPGLVDFALAGGDVVGEDRRRTPGDQALHYRRARVSPPPIRQLAATEPAGRSAGLSRLPSLPTVSTRVVNFLNISDPSYGTLSVKIGTVAPWYDTRRVRGEYLAAAENALVKESSSCTTAPMRQNKYPAIERWS